MSLISELKKIEGFSDKRNSLTKHATRKYRNRALSSVRKIAIHHSATEQGSAVAFARYHVNHNNWPGIGYHFVIEKDGTLAWCHNPEVRSYHVGNSNTWAIGICLVGDFRTQKPTRKQTKAMYALVNVLKAEFDIDVTEVLGHQEFPGYSWKPCPSLDMAEIRQNIKDGKTGIPENEDDSGANPKHYTIQDGDTLWQIAHNHDGITLHEILHLNPEINPFRLKKGQKIRLRA